MLGLDLNLESEWDGKRVVITGGLGFIGSNLAHALHEFGAEVTLFDSGDRRYGANRANISAIADGVEVVSADIRDSGSVEEVVPGVDAVFHLAAQLSRTISVNKPIHDVKVNCIGSLNVLEAVRKHNPGASVVYTGSQASYGVPDELPLSETSPSDPVDIYGANKLAAEKYFNIYKSVHDIDTRTVRLTNVYGPRAQLDNPNYGVINNFIRRALTDEVLTVYEPGTMKRDAVYVGDVVDALLRVESSGAPGVPYVVGSGTVVSVKELAEVIIDVVGGGRIELTGWPDNWDSIRVGDIEVNPTRARTDLGWEPTVALRDGMERTISYYENNLNNYI